MRKLGFFLLACTLAVPQSGRSASIPVRAALKAPESFCQDPVTGDYFISNVNGNPAALDGNGFITRLGPDLKVKKLKFVEGKPFKVTLNGPKGLAAYRGTLYVADINAVRAFDIATGKEKGSFSLVHMDVRFLNDLTVHNGKIYVTDTAKRKVFELDPALNGARLVCIMRYPPNGIIGVPGKKELMIVSWGPGKVVRLDPKTGKYERYFDGEPKGLKNLDGVVFDKKGNLIFSSFTAGKIYRLTPEKKLSVVAEGLTSPADIGIDKQGRLLVPSMQSNSASVLTIPEAE